MKNILFALSAAALLAGCNCGNPVSEISAVSPDGKNVIKLYADPLAFEVLRNGKVVVAKSAIGMKVDGVALAMKEGKLPCGKTAALTGTLDTPVYKKSSVDLAANEAGLCFGDWGVKAIARNDGVAYRFLLKREGEATVDCEKLELNLPSDVSKALVYHAWGWGEEEAVPQWEDVAAVKSVSGKPLNLPFVFNAGGATAALVESDVKDYPNLYLTRESGEGAYLGAFQKYPKKTANAGLVGWSRETHEARGRWQVIEEYEDYLVKGAATRAFPWRAFSLADEPAKLVGSDLVYALAGEKAAYDFSWVKPGKVAWDWWNAWDNQGVNAGCTTKTYERFIDFAAKNGVEYVIFDEGWSAKLNIWKFSEKVDVPHLIAYAAERNVGIILWMAWGQVVGEEAKVAEYFGKLGAKGFKVDFMDRADAAMEQFLWKFADECAKRKLVIDYHGVVHPSGLNRTYPNVLNYEGIHGLEQMKFFKGQDMMFNDVACVFGRLSAGPMDYTPGAMDNYPVGKYPESDEAKGINMGVNPGSMGTRVHQMAMMAAYEAPLQMLSDSPTKYEKNIECFSFMAKTPVVWADSVGLGGTPDTYVALARQAKDGSWYVAVLNGNQARVVEIDTAFLGGGQWKREYFADGRDAVSKPSDYLHMNDHVNPGEKIKVVLAPGGGYVARLEK